MATERLKTFYIEERALYEYTANTAQDALDRFLADENRDKKFVSCEERRVMDTDRNECETYDEGRE